jgi:sugar O-acyltransferase (sialic acid O-acetyltransferase NeuD family)
MKNIAIYGFGGFGREVACLLNTINEVEPTWNFIGFIDDGVPVGTACRYGKVIGNLEFVNTCRESLSIVIAIANCQILKKLHAEIVNPAIDFPNIIAPNVTYFDKDSLEIGVGNLITFNCRISCEVKIGNFNVINGAVSFGHDVQIGDYNVFGPSTRISGKCRIGNENNFGVQSLVLQGIMIGNNTRIGLASVIIRNTQDNKLYFGNPAKKVEGLD